MNSVLCFRRCSSYFENTLCFSKIKTFQVALLQAKSTHVKVKNSQKTTQKLSLLKYTLRMRSVHD